MAGTGSATVMAPGDQGPVTANGELRPGCRCQCRCVPATEALRSGIVDFLGGSPFGAASGGFEPSGEPSPGFLPEEFLRRPPGSPPTIEEDPPPPDSGGGTPTPPDGGAQDPNGERPGDVLGPGGGDPYHPPAPPVMPPAPPTAPPAPPDGQPDPQAAQAYLYEALLSAAAPPPTPPKPPGRTQYPAGRPEGRPPGPPLEAYRPVGAVPLPSLRADAPAPLPTGPLAASAAPARAPSQRRITGGGAPAVVGETLGPFPFPWVYLPPDVAGLQETSVAPRRRPVAPPHAGRFLLGGPDAPADSGIGARPFPVPGYDGVRPWRPSDEAAKRAPFSDLDAHRPVLPARAPSQGIYGDLGPGEPPAAEASLRPFLAPAAVAEPEAEAVRPPVHPAAEFLADRRAILDRHRQALPGATGDLLGGWPGVAAALPAGSPAFPALSGAVTKAAPALAGTVPFLAPGPTVAEAHRPPAGPWGAGQIHAEPPPMEGLAAEVNDEEAAPAPSPALDPVQALKEQIRAQVGQAQGRVPKPEMPGAPGGQRGGKGKNIAALTGMGMPLRTQLQNAMEQLRFLDAAAQPTIGVVVGGPEGKDLATRQREFHEAKDFVKALSETLASTLAPGGSQVEERMDEEVLRQAKAYLREQEREEKKRATTPNYDQWKTGKDAQVGARSSRDQATSIDARAGQLRGKAEPETLRAVKETTKEAKKAAKEAKAAAKKAKDAARFGTKAEAEAAAKAAQDAARYAEQLAADAATILAQAETEALGGGEGVAGQDGGAEGPEDGSGTGGPSPSTAVPHGHETGVAGEKADPCAAIELSCRPGEVRKCEVVCSQDPGGSRFVEAPGVKGRGMPEQPGDGAAAAPGATASPGDGRYGASVSPEGTREEPGEAGAAPEEAPVEESPPESAPTGKPEATDEELKDAAYQTLTELAKLAEELDYKIAVAEHNLSVLSAKLARKKKLTGGESKAYQKNLAELEIYTAARVGVEAMALRVSKALSDGLSSRGQAREDAFVSIRATEWKGPKAVKEFVRDAERELQREFRPVRDPDQLLRDLRQDVEWEVDRRLPPEVRGNAELRDRVRNQVLEERERGDAPGFGSRLASAFSQATASFVGGVGAVAGAVGTALDTVTGRPIRVGILALRDAIHGPVGAGGNLWERAGLGAFSDEIIGGYTGGLSPEYEDSLAVDLLKGVVWTAEVGSGVVGGAVWAKAAGAAGAGARALAGRALGGAGSGGRVSGQVEASLATRVQRLFWDPRDFRVISKEYWAARGGAQGRSLHHWMFGQAARHLPVGLRNAGLNLLEIPSWARVGKLGFNQWMGFAQRWGPMQAGLAAEAEELVRIGVIGAGVVSGAGGYKVGEKIAEYTMPDEGQ